MNRVVAAGLCRQIASLVPTRRAPMITTMSKRSCSKVPAQSCWEEADLSKLPEPTKIDLEMINHLERLSLVEFASQDAIARLENALRFADHLELVDTDCVQPMTTVLEKQFLCLREDEVTENNTSASILSQAAVTWDDYYVTPPGNIALQEREKTYKDSDS